MNIIYGLTIKLLLNKFDSEITVKFSNCKIILQKKLKKSVFDMQKNLTEISNGFSQLSTC